MHTIRLRRPWNRDRDGDAIRVDVPDESELCAERGKSTKYTRHFNRPTGLDSGSRVYLRVESWQGSPAITLNGQRLASPADAHILDVTAMLRSHNELEITLSDAGDVAGKLDGDVSLRIEPALQSRPIPPCGQ